MSSCSAYLSYANSTSGTQAIAEVESEIVHEIEVVEQGFKDAFKK